MTICPPVPFVTPTQFRFRPESLELLSYSLCFHVLCSFSYSVEWYPCFFYHPPKGSRVVVSFNPPPPFGRLTPNRLSSPPVTPGTTQKTPLFCFFFYGMAPIQLATRLSPQILNFFFFFFQRFCCPLCDGETLGGPSPDFFIFSNLRQEFSVPFYPSIVPKKSAPRSPPCFFPPPPTCFLLVRVGFPLDFLGLFSTLPFRDSIAAL